MEALAAHDGAQEEDSDGDGSMADVRSDTQSIGGKTTSTWASNWTTCTNATFNKVHRYANSNSAVHKEVSELDECLLQNE